MNRRGAVLSEEQREKQNATRDRGCTHTPRLGYGVNNSHIHSAANQIHSALKNVMDKIKRTIIIIDQDANSTSFDFAKETQMTTAGGGHGGRCAKGKGGGANSPLTSGRPRGITDSDV